MYTTAPLPGFGKEIKDVDLSKPLDNVQQRSILEIFHQSGLIMIKGQTLTLPEFDRTSLYFGNQKPHFLDHLRLEGHPGILLLSNIFENDKPIGVFEGAAFWHTDVAYEDPGNCATIVYGVKHPVNGCPTYYGDMMSAYDALPQTKKDEIDDLMVLHHYGNRDDMNENSRTAAEKLTEEQKENIQNVHHPLVKTHPITGRKALYGVAGSSFGIVGWPDDKAFALLDELKEHALQPQFTTQLEIGIGDFAAWDNFSTLHKATLQDKATDDASSRLLWRASMVGLPPIYETEIGQSLN